MQKIESDYAEDFIDTVGRILDAYLDHGKFSKKRAAQVLKLLADILEEDEDG